MKKIFISLFALFIFLATPLVSQAATWKPATPEDYTPITWAKATGIASFFKAPSDNGSLDFLTRIYLPQNQIQFVASENPPLDWGPANANFIITIPLGDSTPAITIIPPTTTGGVAIPPVIVDAPAPATSNFHNFAFSRFVAESGKAISTDVKFIWNAPFFNITLPTSDLSLGLKTVIGTTTIISSGSRPDFDMANSRKMLLINNRTAKANIQDFDADIFVGTTSGDQALEGFAPDVAKGDTATARLFIGVMPNKQEVVIYCSQSATINEASRALTTAGVPFENQMQADGGGSASCGYNLPGQYFVEPSRTLPLMMGAMTVIARGNPTTNGLNVRSGAGAKFPVVTKLNKTDQVRVFEEKNGWYRIGAGQWVSKALIKK